MWLSMCVGMVAMSAIAVGEALYLPDHHH
jgi:hypothetical protein